MVDYDLWMHYNVQDVDALCYYLSGYMVMSFSELVLKDGVYIEPDGVEHDHFWCEAPDGRIVDPTVSQFTPGGRYAGAKSIRLDYEDIVEFVDDTPLFDELEDWVRARCNLWLVLVENGRTDSRPGTGQGPEALGSIRAPRPRRRLGVSREGGDQVSP